MRPRLSRHDRLRRSTARLDATRDALAPRLEQLPVHPPVDLDSLSTELTQHARYVMATTYYTDYTREVPIARALAIVEFIEVEHASGVPTALLVRHVYNGHTGGEYRATLPAFYDAYTVTLHEGL